ncbi:unnamed protein product, partial [Brassica napus]
VTGPGSSYGPTLPSVEVSPSAPQSSLPPLTEIHLLGTGVGAVQFGSIPGEAEASQAKNYAELLKSSAQLQELGTPVEHVSGDLFVLIPDENIEAAKREFKDFIYACFHGDYPSMGKIIGVVNAIWARQGPKIFVHNIGQGIYLLRVTNPRTREVLLSRTCWNIGGLPMFVAPWSPDYSPDETPLTSAIVLVEMRNVPYLLFNQESLSRISTAVGKPDSLAPETERKLNFEVAKLYVRVDLTAPLSNKIVSGFSNGKEVVIDVSYPWLPVKCDQCSKFGHSAAKCTVGVSEGVFASRSVRKPITETSRRRSKSRPGRSTAKKVKDGTLRYVPVATNTHDDYKEAESVEVQEENVKILLIINSLQEGHDSELEEGEIYPQVLEVFTASQQSVVEVSGEQKNPAAENPAAENLAAAENMVEEQGALGYVTGECSSDYILESDVAGFKLILLPIPDEAGVKASDGLSFNGNTGDTDVTLRDDETSNNETPAHKGSRGDGSSYPVEEQEQENPFILVKNRRTIPRGWNFFGNYEDDDSSRIVIVWDPRVKMVIYEATSQSVTCGISVLSENITLTVTFVYGFNLVEDQRSLWTGLVNFQATSPVSSYPWSDANISLQDAQLFEAQAKGVPYTWRNSQDDSPISTRIDHAFINQSWSTAFPDSFADFLDPSQSDHAPCLFRMASNRRHVIKPF